jgi:hypothetical protein
LPATADHDAHRQRARLKTPKLLGNARLRQLEQRKLNRHWSPEEISSWLRKAHPDDARMRICHETIYRALLTRDGAGLHKRYAARLRTGQRIRKHRWRHNHDGTGSRIRDMMMIHERPAKAEDKKTPGHWEGDLIIGLGFVSAMITLRERATQYRIVINLPRDHTSATVNTEIAAAFVHWCLCTRWSSELDLDVGGGVGGERSRRRGRSGDDPSRRNIAQIDRGGAVVHYHSAVAEDCELDATDRFHQRRRRCADLDLYGRAVEEHEWVHLATSVSGWHDRHRASRVGVTVFEAERENAAFSDRRA